MTKSGPKFRIPEKEEKQPRPTTEAGVLARSAEVISSGKKKTGRKPKKEPCRGITLSLPVTMIEALDDLASEKTADNRSYALIGVIRGKYKLDEKVHESE